jgi:hypothetical protein
MKNAGRVFEEELEHEVLTGESWPLFDVRRFAGGHQLQANQRCKEVPNARALRLSPLCESG